MEKTFHVIQNIPSPYRLHLFTEMYRQLSERGIGFHVHFMSDFSRGHGDRPKSWHNPEITFPHTYWRDYGFRHYHFNPGMLANLRRIKPEYILVGCPFDTFTSIFTPFVARGAKLCSWTEGNVKTTGEMKGIKGGFKRFVFSQYKYIAVPGIQGKKYIELHQMYTKRRMPECIFLPNLVDETRFKPRDEWSGNEIDKLRAQLGVCTDSRLCLIPARLEWYKGLLEFLDVLPTDGLLSNWRIVIMGQGSLKAAILQSIAEHKLDGIISILDYVPYADMPKYYAAADLFLLPSLHDHNPLTVIEALHSGLPVAVGEMAGNVDEAVSEGCNGWVLPVRNKEEFKKALCKVFSTSTERLREMGKVSKNENARFWNTKDSVAHFLDSFI